MQRELLACDAEEPLETWGKKDPERKLCGSCFLCIKSKINSWLRLELLLLCALLSPKQRKRGKCAPHRDRSPSHESLNSTQGLWLEAASRGIMRYQVPPFPRGVMKERWLQTLKGKISLAPGILPNSARRVPSSVLGGHGFPVTSSP